MDLDRDIQEIASERRPVHQFFYLSVPGGLWLLEKLVVEGYAEKLVHIFQGKPESHNLLPLVPAFAAWWIPFEFSEKHMARLKQRIRDHMSRSGEPVAPIRYTPVEKIVNIAMKVYFDNSLLPPDH